MVWGEHWITCFWIIIPSWAKNEFGLRVWISSVESQRSSKVLDLVEPGLPTIKSVELVNTVQRTKKLGRGN